MWTLCGGLLLYFLESNFLTLLMKPSWEKPVTSISDVLERDMELILWVGMDYYVQVLADSPVELYQQDSDIIYSNAAYSFDVLQLSNSTVLFDDWDITDEMVKSGVIEKRTHVYATDWLWPAEKEYGIWWRGDTILRDISF